MYTFVDPEARPLECRRALRGPLDQMDLEPEFWPPGSGGDPQAVRAQPLDMGKFLIHAIEEATWKTFRVHNMTGSGNFVLEPSVPFFGQTVDT